MPFKYDFEPELEKHIQTHRFPWWLPSLLIILLASLIIGGFYFYQYCERQFAKIETNFIPPPKTVGSWQKRTGYFKKDRIYLLDDTGRWREYKMRRVE